MMHRPSTMLEVIIANAYAQGHAEGYVAGMMEEREIRSQPAADYIEELLAYCKHLEQQLHKYEEELQ